jgi:lipopolysaccharide/colanic/teichoic acid biosynthesis glycosyltransferase
MKRRSQFGKRLFDLTLALPALVLLSPLIAVAAGLAATGVGEMSLIVPRPLLMEYLPHYSTEQNRRHRVLPGITGWAQINGRQLTRFSERLRLDLWYVDHVCRSLESLARRKNTGSHLVKGASFQWSNSRAVSGRNR